MDPQIAAAALQFLERTELKGREVPAFNAVLEALRTEAQRAEVKDDRHDDRTTTY